MVTVDDAVREVARELIGEKVDDIGMRDKVIYRDSKTGKEMPGDVVDYDKEGGTYFYIVRLKNKKIVRATRPMLKLDKSRR